MATLMCLKAVPQHIIHADDFSSVLDGWKDCSDWVEWHGWMTVPSRPKTHIHANLAFRGQKWCCMANLSSIQDGWNESSDWVKWHG